MELTENVFERNGCKIHYWIGGKEDAPLVVFTHGAYIDHREWNATLPLVAGAGFRVLAWDLRGHGLSRPAIFKLAEARFDLLALLDTLAVEQAILVGHSMGGNLQQEVVFHHPERVKALVMLGCTWNFQKLSRLDAFGLKVGIPMLGWYPYNTLIKQMADVSATKPADRAYLREAFSVLAKDEFVHIMAEAALSLHYEPEYRIEKPLLLLVGDQDRTGNIRKAMPLWAKHDGVELIVIPNAQHAANFDQPEIFHQHLLEFLQRTAK